jgi:hypothetical protein
MEEYSFVDIFATKGLEYMVVLVYFVLLVILTKSLNPDSKNHGDKPMEKE